MKDKIINNILGYFFRPPQMGFGLVFMVIGIVIIFSGGFAGIGTGLLLLFFGGAICFTQYGIQLNFQNKEFRKYIKFYYLIKIGSWKSMSDYIYITVIGSNKGYTAVSLTTRRLNIKEKSYDIMLLNSNKSNRLLINSMKSKDMAIDYARKVANNANLEFVI
jgi:hypothetical protein